MENIFPTVRGGKNRNIALSTLINKPGTRLALSAEPKAGLTFDLFILILPCTATR